MMEVIFYSETRNVQKENSGYLTLRLQYKNSSFDVGLGH